MPLFKKQTDINETAIREILTHHSSEAVTLSHSTLDGNMVTAIYELRSALDKTMIDTKQQEIESALKALSNALEPHIIFTRSDAPQAKQVGASSNRQARGNLPTPQKLPGVKHIMLVAAGKGGVGKSTVATNLAATFALQGKKTGLIDADVYGPSVKRMMGISGQPVHEKGKMTPAKTHAISCISMGMILPDEDAVVWRGPMLAKALHQLTFGTNWEADGEPHDIVIIDLPPGTGDVIISLCQKLIVDGAILVSTPQEVALLDVQKALSMFDKVSTPIYGIVENMAYMENENGEPLYPFGQGNVKAYSQAASIPYLGSLPLLPSISAYGDAGTPFVIEQENSDTAKQFRTIAESLWQQMDA